MSDRRFAVLGAGNGGQAFGAHLALLGHEVRLFDVDPLRVDAIATRGGIELTGAIEGVGRPALITSDLGATVEGADVVMIVVPACYHESLAERLAHHLSAGQVVVLNPGATGGALSVRRVLGAAGAAAVVAETESLLYACRSPRPGDVTVYAVKDEVRVGAIPARETSSICEGLSGAFPSFTPVPNVLHTSFGNLNPLVHPAPTLLNAGRIESGQSFQFYRDGMTPTITRVVETLDAERRAVARAYGVDAPSLEASLKAFYDVTEVGLYEIFRNSRVHEGLLAPTTVDSRYLFEDVPTGLVPLAELGRAGGVATPAMHAITDLACVASGRRFWSEGRTLEHLGLAGLTIDEIRAVVTA